MQEMLLVKNGETVISVSIGRTKRRVADVGFVVEVKAHPQVEEFFRDMMPGHDPAPVTIYGRQWVSFDSSPLLAYQLHGDLTGLKTGGSTTYSLDTIGKGPLLQRARTPGEADVVHLGFLRLVGASNGHGITFGVRGVYDKDTLSSMQDSIMRASARFYEQYLKPVNLVVQVSLQEYVPLIGEPRSNGIITI
jgi:hypothetical protein